MFLISGATIRILHYCYEKKKNLTMAQTLPYWEESYAQQ